MMELEIVVISHGGLAEGLRQACSMITGETQHIIALGMEAESGAVLFQERLTSLIGAREGSYVILCDLLHGTPCNLCLRIAQNHLRMNKCKMLSGASLPMLLEGVGAIRSGTAWDAATLAEQMLAAGRIGTTEVRLPKPQTDVDEDEPL